jgi:hypothetical protein
MTSGSAHRSDTWHQSLVSKCGRTTLPREPELVTVHRVRTVLSTGSTGPSKPTPSASTSGGWPTRATCSGEGADQEPGTDSEGTASLFGVQATSRRCYRA